MGDFDDREFQKEGYRPARESSHTYFSNYQQQPDRSRETPKRRWWDRAGDEMLTWFGDDYAERRRRHDDGPHRGKGPKNYKRSDERIRDEVNDRLTDEWNVDASDIEVAVLNGVVKLTGYVDDRWQKRRAEDVAESVSGVRDIENLIKVGSDSPNENINMVP